MIPTSRRAKQARESFSISMKSGAVAGIAGSVGIPNLRSGRRLWEAMKLHRYAGRSVNAVSI